MKTSRGGGEINSIPERKISTSSILLNPGYKIEPVAKGLTFPSGATFDDDGNLYVVETGYAYGEVWLQPKLIRIARRYTNRNAKGEKHGPDMVLVLCRPLQNGNFRGERLRIS